MSLVTLAASCVLLDAETKHRFTSVPEDIGDGWTIGTPEDVGLDPDRLAAMHDELLREDQFFGTKGVLIAKDGLLVFETYLRDPADRDHVQNLQSATKSVTSLLKGIAIDQGLLGGVDTTACYVLGEACAGLSSAKTTITVEHLLTMKSGLDLDNEDMAYELTVREPDDPLRYLLELPLYADPGEEYDYRDVDPQIESYVLQELAGRPEEAYARDALFPLLGIEDVYWQDLHDGASTGAFSLHLRPRDFAKLGQLGLEGGTWAGQRVVSEAWLDEATSIHVADASEGWHYGYNWWISPEGDAITASGHGGQFAMWFPDENLVAVQVAFPDAGLHGNEPGTFYDLVRALW
jgi:CubicO group peptidase (beta-lactamase class C family)